MVEAQQDIDRLEKKRPTLRDPKEFEIIREIYFDHADKEYADWEMAERFDRQNRKVKSKRKSSR
jgi:hypothetical protein